VRVGYVLIRGVMIGVNPLKRIRNKVVLFRKVELVNKRKVLNYITSFFSENDDIAECRC
jgi:hypothetical protein